MAEKQELGIESKGLFVEIDARNWEMFLLKWFIYTGMCLLIVNK